MQFLFCGVTSNHESKGWRISAVLLAINIIFLTVKYFLNKYISNSNIPTHVTNANDS